MEVRDKDGLTEQEFLAQYDPGRYEKPAVTVDMLIFTVNPRKDYGLELLMIERGGHPFLGKWALPGGFVEMEESVDEAAVRELKEETGLSDIYMEQLYTFGDVGRDPRMRVISVAYMALVPKERLRPVAGDDAAKVRWFSVHLDQDDRLWLEAEETEGLADYGKVSRPEYESGRQPGKCREDRWESPDEESPGNVQMRLSESDIAFDHEKVIKTALQRLKNKVEYTDIAFELAGEKFTLTQLQMIYEGILGRKLHKPNFRRSISSQVEKTPEMETKSSNRPSSYYRKKSTVSKNIFS